MNRRTFLLASGAFAALSLDFARNGWDQVASGPPPADGLTSAQLALVAAIADTIIPRTDTPGASDVGVPAWINVMVAKHHTSIERSVLEGGLADIDALAVETNGVGFTLGSPEQRDRVISNLERPADAYERIATRLSRSRRVTQAMSCVIGEDLATRILSTPAQRVRAYRHIKSLVVHGYFTSEVVHNDILRASIMPGYFDGAAPLRGPILAHCT